MNSHNTFFVDNHGACTARTVRHTAAFKSAAVAVLLLCTAASAYSPLGLRYPLGLPDHAVTGAAAAMGGSGAAVADENWGLSLNPANAAIGSRSMFAALVAFNSVTIKEGSNTSTVSGYAPKLLSLIIPIGKAGNLGFAMQQRYDANLNFYTTEVLQDNLAGYKSATIEHSRSGGLTAWQAGWAFRFKNGLSLGLAYERLYFNRDYRDHFESIFRYDDDEGRQAQYRASAIETVTSNFVSDGIRFGVQVPVHEKVTLAAAAEYIMPGSDNGNLTREYIRREGASSAIIEPLRTGKFSVDLPPAINIGAAYAASEHWLFAADAHCTLWEVYENSFEAMEPERVYGMSAGARFIPTANKLSAAYWEIISYSAGFRYTSLPGTTAGSHEYAATLGVGLPIANDGGTVDIAIDIGQRTDARYSGYSENFVKFQLGINGGRNWFQQDASRR